ncbi:MAG TPA: hypothetical protein VK698_20530 [Kofleriaceae bacterium]|nr:hypothetical protein [Kofleriaceae bacterium]
MDRPVDAARFTRKTLSWFEEGEAIAASECATAAELADQRSPVRFVAVVTILLALIGVAAVLVTGQL